jgi:hypothetical protein
MSSRLLTQLLWMRLLEISGANLARWDLRGDGEDRHARAMTVEQAVDEMHIARPATTGTDRKLSGQMRLGAGCEGGDLFVPDMHPFDLALPTN